MIGTELAEARKYLIQGKVVAIPTETVYGLAGNALNTSSIVEIFHIKNRPFFDPLIVHVGSWEQVQQLTTHIPQTALDMAAEFWPGALTLLLPRSNIVPDLVTSGLPHVAVRMPKHEMAVSLLNSLNFPLAAPSANPFGYISPTTAQHVEKQLGDKIPYILDGGPCHIGVESTIIGFDEHEHPVIYRLGGIPIERIEAVAGRKLSPKPVHFNKPQAAGQLDSHYAPTVPLQIGHLAQLIAQYDHNKKIGILSFAIAYNLPNATNIILSENGNIDEAAANLFAALRQLDEQKPEIILAEWVPDTGLGRAINDRLRRAAAKRT